MQTEYLRRPEGELAYSDYGGSGHPVLMLPGMGALRREYRFLAPALAAAGFHAIAADLRGHGESSVSWPSYDVPSIGSDIFAFAEHLDAGPIHVIGTSKAAASTVWAAAERPDLVRSVVLVGAFVRAVKINPIMGFLFWLMMNNPWQVHAWAAYYGTIYPTQKPEDFKDYIRDLKANLSQPGRFKAVKAVGNSSAEPSEERLGLLKSPALVMMGTDDPDFPDPVAEGELIADRTGGSLALIEGAGHYPQSEMPEKTIPVIIDFLGHSG